MAHLDLDFPLDVASGAQATLERRDEVVMLASGHEEVNQRWADARRSWDVGFGLRDADDLAAVVALFEEVRGRANSFRFRDWMDWKSCAPSATPAPIDQPLGTGDGVTSSFQLIRRYGSVNAYDRPIALPHPASVRVAVNGVETGGFSVSSAGGTVIFAAPPAPGAILTAGFTFDVPVRFDQATLSVQWAFFTTAGGVASMPEITLTEVRLD